ncbi:MAG TPA: exodeoxyribonuclease VII large subunit [Pirellulaceae bacterium]|jgi:exodeoxyribonuclease VII large subunit
MLEYREQRGNDEEAYPLFASATEPKVPKILTVGQLSQLIEMTLETMFPSLWVSGEITEVTRPHSGHIYFTLRDDTAQIRAVIWRSAAARLKFRPEEGQQVICQGGLDVYPPRGTYQLVVQQIEPQGLGALQLALKQLQQRLAAEGLFDPAHKKQLPAFPRRVGFVTSPTGAAIRDFLQVAARRFHGVAVLVIPAKVQGDGAASEIVRGIQLANRIQPPLDVLVVGRGGGSSEDLWCFNDEAVVRAIFASTIPVVSAVGHEIDVTLSDLVADVRALTPSEAAERVIPSAEELKERLATHRRRLAAVLKAKAVAARRHLNQLSSARVLRNPRALIDDLIYRIDELDGQASRAIDRRIRSLRDRLSAIASRTEALSPLAVLGRGYSVTSDAETGRIITGTEQVAIGTQIRTRLATGSLLSRVESIEGDKEGRFV